MTRSLGSESLTELTLDEVIRSGRKEKRARKKMEAQMNELVNQLKEELAQLRKDAIPEKKEAIGAADTPHTFYSDRSPVIIPTLTEEVTIHPQLISLVKQNQFHALPSENPTDHIEGFEAICTTSKKKGVSEDYLPCILFKFSLADKAERWWKSLPANSLSSWKEVRAAFLDSFYTKSKTASLRSRISGFQQGTNETFGDAWDRYKGYKRDCPHHGYSESHLLNFFYEGVHWEFKTMLNAASKGDFMKQDKDGAIAIIENMSASMNSRSGNEKGVKVHSIDGQRIEDINTKLDILMKEKKTVHFAKEEEDELDDEADVNYVGNFNQQYQQNQQTQEKPWANNWKPNQPTTKRTWGNENYQPQPANFGIKQLLESILDGQNKMIGTFNGKIDNVYGEFQQKFEAISSHLKKLDTQVAQTAESVRRQEGFLPGKTDSNPRAQINMIFGVLDVPYRRLSIDEGGIVDRHRAFRNLYQPSFDTMDAFVRRNVNKLMFYVSCTESSSGMLLPNCLCDSGASVNIMSWNAAQRMNLKVSTPIIPHAEIADGSTVRCLGYIPDVYLAVEEKLIGVDFHIFHMANDRRDQIILGIDFLEATGAIMDFSTHQIFYTKLDDKADYRHPAEEDN